MVTSTNSSPMCSLAVKADDQHLDDLLRQLFDSDEATVSTTVETDICEEIFMATHKRDPEGRYCVQIPFRPDAPALGNSHHLALRQFYQLERRLVANPDWKEKYVAFMREYISLGHMHVISDQLGDPSQAYYFPHHAVAAKFLVVFNASAKSSNGVSLNDTQLIGSPLQPLLVNIIFNFGLGAVALSADVEKMFRQVRVEDRHRPWQQILWRESPTEPLRVYQLATVTYGTASGHYLAIRAMQQCGIDNCDKLVDGNRAAVAPKSILRDFYVDAETTILGLHWDSVADELFYKIKLDDSLSTTKRQILSEIARLYDPTGMLAPVIIVGKIFIQRLWQAGLTWDVPLPTELLNEWLSFRNGLRQLEIIRIPRWLGVRPETTPRLHGFCDASAKAYAAVIYVCTLGADGRHTSQLLTSKTQRSHR